jgi:tetratricopeptide (TPR) repeat protein
MSLERALTTAQGYLELGMPSEALRELDQLPPELASSAEILQLRLLILMRMHEWKAGLEISEKLRKNYPTLNAGYIHGAYCLHELKRTEEARDLLKQGPETLQLDPTYHYNMACYEATLGNLDPALNYLRSSFAMDPGFREIAMHDPDLASLRGSF